MLTVNTDHVHWLYRVAICQPNFTNVAPPRVKCHFTTQASVSPRQANAPSFPLPPTTLQSLPTVQWPQYYRHCPPCRGDWPLFSPHTTVNKQDATYTCTKQSTVLHHPRPTYSPQCCQPTVLSPPCCYILYTFIYQSLLD